jgi:hypothetical protein
MQLRISLQARHHLARIAQDIEDHEVDENSVWHQKLS